MQSAKIRSQGGSFGYPELFLFLHALQDAASPSLSQVTVRAEVTFRNVKFVILTTRENHLLNVDLGAKTTRLRYTNEVSRRQP